MKPLLFEIGTEELPARFVASAIAALDKLVSEGLAAASLPHGERRTFATPRRLTVLLDVAEQSRGSSTQALGPSVRAAYDASGAPTQAALGFARRMNMPVERLERAVTEKGEYVVARIEEPGRPALELLPAILGKALQSLEFPKVMRWGDVERTFARPVRWLCALYGSDQLRIVFGDVTSGRRTYGHRFLAPSAIELDRADAYPERLARAHVIADVGERRAELERRVAALAATDGASVRSDPELLDEIVQLVEQPVPILGTFAQEYLALPPEVLVAEMRQHQRCLSLLDRDGRMLPRFIAVSNTQVEDPSVSARGFSRVLRARLSDAQFFLSEDKKRPLQTRRAELSKVLFHHRLGSIGEKVARLEQLAGTLAEASGQTPLAAVASRAAGLCKCDLVTLMVGEFPDLQGVMGRVYALHDGEDAAVAQAIEDHYRPRGTGDQGAIAVPGALVGIADRIDSLVGLFAVGERPTGTSDAFALRRAAIAIVGLAVGLNLRFSLAQTIAAAERLLAPTLDKYPRAERGPALAQALSEFFRARMRALWAPRFGADVVDAVLATDHDSVLLAHLRVVALARVAREKDFAAIGTVFKRVVNILQKAPELDDDQPRREQLLEAPELELYDAWSRAASEVRRHVAAEAFEDAFRAIVTLEAPLARFFDEVLVMTDDVERRAARFRLLSAIAALFRPFADLSYLAQSAQSGPPAPASLVSATE